MKPTSQILERIHKNAIDHKDGVYTRLYRYLLREDTYYLAYQKLYANKGASTRGIDRDTADGFGKAYVDSLIQDLTQGTYQPKPVRRTYIKKANGKLRPLGIPSFRDKLLQEVIRRFLEAIYEPNFCDYSHGFRPNRSCHTALKQAKVYFTGAKWFIEGDIKGCFDNIEHKKLIEILERKIKDSKFIGIIRQFLQAGYMEDWNYQDTFSGAPQGNILSPILANIYLNELDTKIMEIQSRFQLPRDRKYTYEYSVMKGRRDYQKAKLKKAKEEEKPQILELIRQYSQALYSIPRTPDTDKNLHFVRYADDFLIAVKGSKEDCIAIKEELAQFLLSELGLTLSEEKTLITHSSEKALFLGYNISIRRDWTIKPNGQGSKARLLNGKVELTVPFDRIEKFMFERGIIRQTKAKAFRPIHRKGWLYLPDYAIIERYNAELRGVLNYYNLAVDYNHLGYFRYLMEYSCLATLAGKHNSSISKIIDKYRKGKYWSVSYVTSTGAAKERRLVQLKDCKDQKGDDTIIRHWYIPASNATIRARLQAGICELCDKRESASFEVHHVPSVKNLDGEELWVKLMKEKRRKTLVVCEDCHKAIHT